jgi:hypothetical protein
MCVVLYRSEEIGSLRNYSSVRTTMANFVHDETGTFPTSTAVQVVFVGQTIDDGPKEVELGAETWSILVNILRGTESTL